MRCGFQICLQIILVLYSLTVFKRHINVSADKHYLEVTVYIIDSNFYLLFISEPFVNYWFL